MTSGNRLAATTKNCESAFQPGHQFNVFETAGLMRNACKCSKPDLLTTVSALPTAGV